MLFDRPAALPVATMRSRSHVARFASRARGGWLWLRPRTIPMAVALAGMLAVLGSAKYLTKLARETPQPEVAQIQLSSTPPAGVLTINDIEPATIIIDGNPSPPWGLPGGRVIELPAGCAHRVQLVPAVR